MDPNETLAELRALVAQAGDGSEPADARVSSFALLFGGLDEFLSRGGFLPKPWQDGRPSAEQAFKAVHAAIAIRPKVDVTDVAEIAAKFGVRL